MADGDDVPNAAGRSTSVVLWLSLAFAAGSALLGSSCLDRRDTFTSSAVTRCATCHGDPSRSGDYLLRAAPPHDTTLATDVSYPGVGAHQIHLRPSATHAAIACGECHHVPKSVDEPGHADSARPAKVTFGALSRSEGRAPSYDAATRTCRDTYCHRAADAVWTSPRDSAKACGSCHGLPPKAPHPASSRCSACHGRVVDEARRIVAPELHVDGVVEYTPSGCGTCHGRGDDPAPPVDTQGNDASSFPGVGAHQAHLAPNSVGRVLACDECHVVPSAVDSPGHVDGTVQVVLSSIATSGDHSAARFDPATRTCTDTWCHGAASGGHAPSPEWTSAAALGCDSCHGDPPPAPHPQMTECARCHGAVVADDGASIKDPARHVDGTIDVDVPEQCTSCHGGVNPAPPADTAGNTATTAAGVGAHQTHVLGTPRSRPVPCDECHLVPKKVLDAGHVDTARPAEVRFAGAASSFGGEPAYSNGSCRDTSCHGAVFPNGDASGGTNTAPAWTKVDGTQAACGSCHGLPPPPPHPYAELNPVCNKCHQDVNADNATFSHPELHVDGRVTFALP
jgi:predicted CxxxxCH...CXXCH cytochrome family protein